MKQIILKQISLENFKGNSRKANFGDSVNRISGRNRSGKTTLFKAWCWLLTGYSDANTALNADLYDNRFEVSKDTPTACVEAVVLIDGLEYKLKRTATAKFTRKRGTTIDEKAPSDDYKFYIDDIERNATDFKAWLSENIADEDMLRFLLGGDFFIKNIFDDKKKARRIIESVVGSVGPEDMKGDYSLIKDLMERYSIEDIEKQATNMAKAINERLTEIPTLIDNAQTEIAELEQTDFKALSRAISQKEKERTDTEHQISDLAASIRPQMEERAKASQAKEMKMEIYRKAYMEWCGAYKAEKDRLMSEISAINQQNSRAANDYNFKKNNQDAAIRARGAAIDALKKLEEKREALLKERDEQLAVTFDPSSVKCPYCGAQLTGDKLNQSKAQFEAKKRAALETIVAKGKANNAEIEETEAKIYKFQEEIDAVIEAPVRQSTEELEKKLTAYGSIDLSESAYLATDEGLRLYKEAQDVIIPDVTIPNDEALKQDLATINEELKELYKKEGLKSRIDVLRTKIDELTSEQKEKGAELADYEKQAQLCKDYKQEQIEILSNNVNSGLAFGRIDVWSTQKDGTVVPDLVLKDTEGVPYSTTNNASRIKVSCDVQRFFCERLGVNMPMWVDEATIINDDNMPKYDGTQMFFMFCAETSLKIECE